jgi:NADH-quinone oxidoreductase subunit L
MFLGLGTGAFSAGIWHVMTHAFFKALLFLGAGSVIHALSGEQDLRKMGGLRKYTPITMWTLLCGSVAIAGVPPFSGFYSKDAILAAAYDHAPWMYWVGVFTAGMTAFYVFRAFFMAFFGEYRGKEAESHGHSGHDDHGHGAPHESPPVMWIPLAILAVLSLIGGWAFNIPKFLAPMFPLVEETPGTEWTMYVSIAAGLLGIGLAYLFYVVSPSLPESLASTFSGPYRWLYNKYFVDEFYDSVVISPTVDGSRSLLWRVVDAGGIDRIVNGVGKTARNIGGLLRRPQSGLIRSYAAWVVLGSILLIIYAGFTGGSK